MRKCTVEAQCLPACSRRVLLLITPALSSLSLLKEQTERSCLCSLSLCVLLVVDDPGDSVLTLSLMMMMIMVSPMMHQVVVVLKKKQQHQQT